MTTTTSRRLRKTGLAVAFIGFCATSLPMVVRARFGEEYDWLMPPQVFLVVIFCPYVGLALYLIGRFQYDPSSLIPWASRISDHREARSNLHRRTLWSVGAKATSLGFAVMAVWALSGSARSLIRDWRGDSGAADALLSLLLTILLSAGLLWVAWRLWQRWSSGTVRIVTGLAVAWASMALYGLLFELFYDRSTQMRPTWDGPASATALLILVAVAYRKTSRAVIRWSKLDDPLDAHGHPAGHMERARAFCILLGWSVWLTASGAAMAMTDAKMPTAGAIGAAVAIGLGWIVYRSTLWWMTPPTRAALPPGRGFEVLPSGHYKGADRNGAMR